jgi:ubiquinone/menaquinone biosynthesis C-methylase UbiE
VSQDLWQDFQNAWGDSAADYDSLFGHGMHSAAEKQGWKLLIQRLLPVQTRPLTVLDVGTGTGCVALLAAELGHEVTASDYSPQMLRVAQAKADEQGLDIRFVLTDALLDGIDHKQFDVVISRHLIWALQNPEEALARWREVCRPGGKVVVIDQLRPKVSLPRQALRDLADLLHPVFGTGDRHDGDFPRIPFHLQPLKRVSTPRPTENAMRRAGLTAVQSERLPWIDDVERRSMPRLEKWARRWNRYVVEGWV